MNRNISLSLALVAISGAIVFIAWKASDISASSKSAPPARRFATTVERADTRSRKGYDCGPDSDWMMSACNWNPECANGGTYVEFLQRQLGSQYDDAARMANSIDEAITAKDVQTLRSYL